MEPLKDPRTQNIIQSYFSGSYSVLKNGGIIKILRHQLGMKKALKSIFC